MGGQAVEQVAVGTGDGGRPAMRCGSFGDMIAVWETRRGVPGGGGVTRRGRRRGSRTWRGPGSIIFVGPMFVCDERGTYKALRASFNEARPASLSQLPM